jgi:hypothetical protein
MQEDQCKTDVLLKTVGPARVTVVPNPAWYLNSFELKVKYHIIVNRQCSQNLHIAQRFMLSTRLLPHNLHKSFKCLVKGTRPTGTYGRLSGECHGYEPFTPLPRVGVYCDNVLIHCLLLGSRIFWGPQGTHVEQSLNSSTHDKFANIYISVVANLFAHPPV